jgi:positive regulator of sigma E activity
MIEEDALVKHAGDDSVVFQVIQTGPCNECSIREYCYRNDGFMSVERGRLKGADAEALAGVRQDTPVKLRIPNTSILGLSSVVYGVPLLAFVGGLLLGYFGLFGGAGSELQALGAFGTAVAFLSAAGFGISRFDKKVARRLQYEVALSPGTSRAAAANGCADGEPGDAAWTENAAGWEVPGEADRPDTPRRPDARGGDAGSQGGSGGHRHSPARPEALKLRDGLD